MYLTEKRVNDLVSQGPVLPTWWLPFFQHDHIAPVVGNEHPGAARRDGDGCVADIADATDRAQHPEGSRPGLCRLFVQQFAAEPQDQRLRVRFLVMLTKRLYSRFVISHPSTSALSFTHHAAGLVQQTPLVRCVWPAPPGIDRGQDPG